MTIIYRISLIMSKISFFVQSYWPFDYPEFQYFTLFTLNQPLFPAMLTGPFHNVYHYKIMFVVTLYFTL